MDNSKAPAITDTQSVQDKPTHYNFANLCIMFFIFAFTGWIWEVIYIGFTEGVIAKRGMLHGPWLPIYGVGGILILLILSRFRTHPAAVFAIAVLLCASMEYATGVAVEYLFHCRWWDYSDKFFNIHGRICLEGMMLFGVSGTVAVCKVGPMLNRKIGSLRWDVHLALIILLGGAFLIDLFVSLFVAPNTGVGVTYELLTRI
ncbi:MAG: putative ABC transporter permease [Clostridia bacterium]|nr:putative ABC transporter permease [Clostridia bacterium]